MSNLGHKSCLFPLSFHFSSVMVNSLWVTLWIPYNHWALPTCQGDWDILDSEICFFAFLFNSVKDLFDQVFSLPPDAGRWWGWPVCTLSRPRGQNGPQKPGWLLGASHPSPTGAPDHPPRSLRTNTPALLVVVPNSVKGRGFPCDELGTWTLS